MHTASTNRACGLGGEAGREQVRRKVLDETVGSGFNQNTLYTCREFSKNKEKYILNFHKRTNEMEHTIE